MHTWEFSLSSAAGSHRGQVQGVDLRDAVSRVMTSSSTTDKEDDGELLGDLHAVPTDILNEAPGNDQASLQVHRDGFSLTLTRH